MLGFGIPGMRVTLAVLGRQRPDDRWPLHGAVRNPSSGPRDLSPPNWLVLAAPVRRVKDPPVGRETCRDNGEHILREALNASRDLGSRTWIRCALVLPDTDHGCIVSARPAPAWKATTTGRPTSPDAAQVPESLPVSDRLGLVVAVRSGTQRARLRRLDRCPVR